MTKGVYHWNVRDRCGPGDVKELLFFAPVPNS